MANISSFNCGTIIQDVEPKRTMSVGVDISFGYRHIQRRIAASHNVYTASILTEEYNVELGAGDDYTFANFDSLVITVKGDTPLKVEFNAVDAGPVTMTVNVSKVLVLDMPHAGFKISNPSTDPNSSLSVRVARGWNVKPTP